MVEFSRSGPHRLEAQDVALSRPKQGFESPWGHHFSGRSCCTPGSFDPFKRQEFDLRNQEIYALHKQGVTVRELAQRYGLSEKRVWGVCTAERKVKQE